MSAPNFNNNDFLQEWIEQRVANDLLAGFNAFEITIGMVDETFKGSSLTIANDNIEEE